MALIDSISKELIKRYRTDNETQKKDTGYIYLQHGTGNFGGTLTVKELRALKWKAKKYKTKSFHVESVDPVQSDQIVGYCFNINIERQGRKYNFGIDDMTGVFKMTFSDGTFMYFAKFVQGYGRNHEVMSLFAAEKEVWMNFFRLVKKSRRYKMKPKNGVYRIHTMQSPMGMQLIYENKKDLNETPIIHPEIDRVNSDLEFFFKNLSLFTRFKMPGTRKALLVGEPGSGKSSYCTKLALKRNKEFCIVFATQLSAVAMHMQKCAKYDVATIVILEDAETTVSNANSDILNFLDGIDQPTNKNGCYIIMTTNFPQRIEPRILQRPGRIDKIFKFDALHNKHALACAKIYLSGYLTEKEETTIFKNAENSNKLISLVDGMTGAQIKGLIDSSVSLAVSEQRDLSLETIAAAKEQMFKDLKEVYKYAEEKSLNGHKKRLGFVTNENEARKDIFSMPIEADEDMPF